ncbi:MAG TPA: DUF952 domain-containing protein [Candidatus Limnocylindrales bacterium]|jgi:uncharacterized protein (DUF952 family)/uncharacterized protein YciI
MRPTYHLVPETAWRNRDPAAAYAAPSLASEGFIHCTDGADAMVATANRHYRDVPGSFLILTVDLDATGSPWRFDDDSGIYPHIYGPIAPAAVLREQSVPRSSGGEFLAFGGSGVPAGVRVETIYVVEATYGPDAERLRPFSRPEHLGHIGDLLRSGRVIEAGGYLDFTTAILLVQAASEAEALGLFRDDIYVRTGVWTELRARAYGRVIAEPS